MKLLNKHWHFSYTEIEVEHTFLWFFTYRSKYRLYQPSGTIMKFKEPDNYYNISTFEHFDIIKYFHINNKGMNKEEMIKHVMEQFEKAKRLGMPHTMWIPFKQAYYKAYEEGFNNAVKVMNDADELNKSLNWN